MRFILLAPLIAGVLALAPVAASGQDYTSESDVGFRGWGPRIGITDDPDQIHFGAHADYGNFARHVRFQPNIEVGISDHLTLIALNFEAAYRFREQWDVWSPYLGGGAGVNIADYDDERRGDDTDTDLGVSVLGGIERGLRSGDRFFLEMKLGLSDDTPDIKLTAGWTFYH